MRSSRPPPKPARPWTRRAPGVKDSRGGRGPELGLGVEHSRRAAETRPALVAAAVSEHVSDEKCNVQRLPRARPPRGRLACFDAFVLIRDRQADPGQAPLLEGWQELDPEAARLDLADIQADHFPSPVSCTA